MLLRWLAALATAAALGACPAGKTPPDDLAIDHPGDLSIDGTVPDVTPDRAPVDQQQLDLGPPDLQPKDLLSLDKAKPDLLASCSVKYGGAPQFDLCSQTTTSCTFEYVANSAVSCSHVCNSYGGGACLKANNDKPGSPCVSDAEIACATEKISAICTCER